MTAQSHLTTEIAIIPSMFESIENGTKKQCSADTTQIPNKKIDTQLKRSLSLSCVLCWNRVVPSTSPQFFPTSSIAIRPGTASQSSCTDPTSPWPSWDPSGP